MRSGQIEKHGCNAIQDISRFFHRNKRICKCGAFALIGNGLHLFELLLHASFESGQEMLGFDSCKIRCLQRQRTRFCKWIRVVHRFAFLVFLQSTVRLRLPIAFNSSQAELRSDAAKGNTRN